MHYVAVSRALGGAVVTAVFDTDLSRAQRVAAEIGVTAYDDLSAFLAANIDAVVVASPVLYHVDQTKAALAAGKHVLSEVTPCTTIEEARALVQACRSNNTVYMLAENFCSLDEIELVKRLHDAGRFGDLYYAEADYVNDCRWLWFNPDGRPTWRAQGFLGVYCNHNLGPLLYIMNDRVVRVSALEVPGGLYDSGVTFPTMHLLQMVTARGITLRARVDHVSARPSVPYYYSVQGTSGCYESGRSWALGECSKVWLADEHEPEKWHWLEDQAALYIPDRLALSADTPGHGRYGGEYWLLQDFLAAVRGERPPSIDVYRGLDYTLPGIYAIESAAKGGTPVIVADPRTW